MLSQVSIKDIYEEKYDYDDLKIAVCIADNLSEWKVVTSYEEIAGLTIKIRNMWKENQEKGLLTEEEFAYIQKFANRFIRENKYKIMEELS